MNEKQIDYQLHQLQETLPPGLPEPPKFLVELARERKKLNEIRALKNKEAEKRHQGIILESYKKCLVEVDKMHMKGAVELKSLIQKSQKLSKYISEDK